MIHYIIYCNQDHGDIVSIKPAKGQNPAHNSINEQGLRVLHYLSTISNISEFHITKYWNGTDWATRTAPPNIKATWNNGQWTWLEEDFLSLVRSQRDFMIAQTDWSILPDSPLSESQKTEARTYRQSLRDLTSETMPVSGNLNDVSWPTVPSFLTIVDGNYV